LTNQSHVVYAMVILSLQRIDILQLNANTLGIHNV
jgi:hypothetical protein